MEVIMSKYYVLFNPLAGNNTGRDETVKLTKEASLQEHELIFTDMTTLSSYKDFFVEKGAPYPFSKTFA